MPPAAAWPAAFVMGYWPIMTPFDAASARACSRSRRGRGPAPSDLILAWFPPRRRAPVESKADGTPVTAADREADD
jgi:hypothetical protein